MLRVTVKSNKIIKVIVQMINSISMIIKVFIINEDFEDDKIQ